MRTDAGIDASHAFGRRAGNPDRVGEDSVDPLPLGPGELEVGDGSQALQLGGAAGSDDGDLYGRVGKGPRHGP